MTAAQIEMTLDVMAHSLVYWAQDVVRPRPHGRGRPHLRDDLGRRAPARCPPTAPSRRPRLRWSAHIRQLAVELAPRGITANAIRAGVTDTPAAAEDSRLRADRRRARRRNPSGRLTTPDDVARAIVALSHADTAWITGNVIGVDGGEDVVG